MSSSGSGFGDGSPTRFDGGFDFSPGSFLRPLSCMIISLVAKKTVDRRAAFLELTWRRRPPERFDKQILTAAFQFAPFPVISR